MLGERIADEIGQTISSRVLPPHDGAARMEVTYQAAGTILGLHYNDTGTYVATLQPDGTLRGEGHGVIMTEDGGVATWVGSGVGKPTGRGMGATWRGALLYKTSSPSLVRLNSTVGLFEFAVDETNKTEGLIYEWK